MNFHKKTQHKYTKFRVQLQVNNKGKICNMLGVLYGNEVYTLSSRNNIFKKTRYEAIS